MAVNVRRVSTGTICFWSSAVVSIVTIGVLIAIAIRLGHVDAEHGTRLHGLFTTAAALDVLTLVGVFAAVVLFLLRTNRRLQVIFCAIFMPLAFAAAFITMYSLAWLWTAKHNASSDEAETATTITEAGFAVWTASVCSQILLFAVVLWPHDVGDAGLPAAELTARLESAQSTKRSLSVRMRSFSSPRQSPYQERRTETIESHFSSPSLSPRSSFRRSVSHAIRPMTSKTRLLFRSSMISRDSPSLYSVRDTSLDAVRAENEFHNWDTTGVEERTSDPFVTRSTRRTRLDPIPGSRPVSPAKRLDGPFEEDAAADTPLPESPLASPVLSRSTTGSARTRPRALSRPHSSNSQNDNSHIHPLFRSDSPNPPPLASPGTIITASPYAGQVVSPEQQYFSPPRRFLSTNGSRPASPSPLAPVSPSRSRQGSFKSIKLQHSSPTEQRSPSALAWGENNDG